MNKKLVPSAGTVLSICLSGFAVYSVTNLSVDLDSLASDQLRDVERSETDAVEVFSDAELSTVLGRLGRLERSVDAASTQSSSRDILPTETGEVLRDDEAADVPLLARADSGDLINAALAEAFDRPESDPVATGTYYDMLQHQLGAHRDIAAGTSVEALDCGSTSCVAEFLHSDESSADTFRSRLRLFFPWSQAGHITSEGLVSTAYVSSDISMFEGILVAAQR